METITNKEVNVRLDNEKGTLCLTGLLAGTMVFLYDSQGELKGKHKFAFIDYGNPSTGYLCFGNESSELPTGSPEVYIFRDINNAGMLNKKHTGILFKWKLLISEYQSVSTSVNSNCFTAVDFLGK